MHRRDGDEDGNFNSIKLFHFVNGMIIVGIVDKFHNNTANVVSPALVSVETSPEGDVIGYEFDPYLSPMLPFDPCMQEVSINMNVVICCADPSEHVIRNYASYMKLHRDEAAANEAGATALDVPLKPEEQSKPTFH